MRTVSILAGLALLAGSSLASAHLQPGAKAPDFAAKGAIAGKLVDVKLRDALKRGPVVLYFYPAAFSGGCDLQAREFSEATDSFKKAGATVIGMSNDPIDKLQKFSVERCSGKFAVAAASPSLIKAYDVAFVAPPGLSAEMAAAAASRTNRTTYVIAPNGKITFVYSNLSHTGHVQKTLAAVQQMRPRKGAKG